MAVAKRDKKKTPSSKSQRRPKSQTKRPGLPDPASIVSEKVLISPKGNRYRVLTTTQSDAYDDATDRAKKRD
jgi:hypothetical protein